MQHECQHEKEIVTMNLYLVDIRDIVTRLEECMNGNGQPGIKTRLAQVEDGLNRSWWFLGGVGVALLGLLGGVLAK